MQSGFTSIRYAVLGTELPEINHGPVDWPAEDTDKQNAIQQVGVVAATGGTFTLSFKGEETAPIAYDALPETVEKELELLDTIGQGNVHVTGSIGEYDVEFIRDLGYQAVPLLVADDSELSNGGAEEVVVVEIEAGNPGGGVWTPVPNVDPEKDVKLVPEATGRALWSPGSARPTRTHIIRAAVAEIQLVSTQSSLEALQFLFPAYPVEGRKLTLRAVSIETPYVALALEVPKGVFHFVKVAPNNETELAMMHSDITQPDFTLVTHENEDREVGYYHEFID